MRRCWRGAWSGGASWIARRRFLMIWISRLHAARIGAIGGEEQEAMARMDSVLEQLQNTRTLIKQRMVWVDLAAPSTRG